MNPPDDDWSAPLNEQLDSSMHGVNSNMNRLSSNLNRMNENILRFNDNLARYDARGSGSSPASRSVRSTTRDDNGGVRTYETTNASTFRTDGNDNERSFPGTEFESFPDFPQGGFGEFGSFPDMPPMPPMPTFDFAPMNDLMAPFGGPGDFGAFGPFRDESDDMNVPGGGSGASLSHRSQPAQGNAQEDKTMDNNITSGSATASDVAEGTRPRTLSLEREVKSSEKGYASTTATTQASKSGRSLQPTVEDDLEDWEVV